MTTKRCLICGGPTEGDRLTCSKACRYALVSLRHREAGTRPPPQTEEQRIAASDRMRGAGCPKWNGGRTTGGDRGRYILVRVAGTGWPWPEMADNRGYVREHRKVMAETLGRALCREEVVHHLNGDTRDNSPGNLSLYPCNSAHMADHSDDGLMDRRWPACIFGCGRQAKPLGGRHFQACARCRRLVAHRRDPRRTATY